MADIAAMCIRDLVQYLTQKQGKICHNDSNCLWVYEIGKIVLKNKSTVNTFMYI